MANVDTGLGWSAEGTYLREPALLLGSISTFGGPDFPGQPIPKNATTNDEVLAKAFKIADQPAYNAEYYVATEGGANVVIYFISNTDGYVHFISNSNTEYVRLIRYRVDTHIIQAGQRAVATTPVVIGGNTVYHGMLFDAGFGSSWMPYLTSYIPFFTDDNDADSHLTISTVDFNKVNAGYATASVAKWVTPAGVTITSPILISSVSENTDMSCSSSEYNFARLSVRYDGITFYMSFFDVPNQDIATSLPNDDLTYLPVLVLEGVFNVIASSDYANILVMETVDPYAPFGNTEEGGGEVDPDPEDDDIEEPSLPGLSFAATGLCRIYRADLIALNQLANYMWTDNTFLQTLVNHAIQLIENPMDAIISLCLVPVAPPAFSVGAAEAVSVMYIPTPASMWPVINQFARVDCGTLDLKETYGSALDYNPYTKVSCFLPYIGFVDLDTDEVMGKTLNVVYRIDVVTGVCVAMIKVDGEVMYQFSGHCAIQMPLSSADFSTVISSLLQAGKLVAGAALTAAGAPEVGGMLLDAPQVSQPSTTVRKMVGTERNPNTGRQITTGTVTETVEKTGKPLALGELAKRQSANTVGAIMNSKFGIEHSGGFSGNSGYLGVRRPFIIVKRPRLANPEQYGQYNGRPSMIYLNLGICTGYTEVQSIQLTGIAATNSELSEIATLLKTGVIL